VFAEQGHLCAVPDCYQPAAELDHIVSLAEGGSDDIDNLQGLCTTHHQEKTRAEAVRGQRRRHGNEPDDAA